nr:PREDICTED: diamine acetyltransferase 2 [Bemisia tabaci]
METVNGLIIRKAVREDCPQILALIKEMAAFQKHPDAVEVDVSVLERDGFDGEHPFYFAVVAEDPNINTADGRGKLVGYSICNYAYGTWAGKKLFIEDIYVTESYRSKKVGSALFNLVNKIAVETGCAKIDWHVTKWNSGAREFYHHKGAISLSELEDWLVYRLEKEAMTELYQKTTARQGTGTKGQQS